MSNEQPIIDDFRGDDAHLIESARALIALSDRGAMAPHGIGGHARGILSAFIVRTEAALTREAPTEGVGLDYDEILCLLHSARTNIGARRPDHDEDDAAHWDRLTAAMESLKSAALRKLSATPPAPQRLAQGEDAGIRYTFGDVKTQFFDGFGWAIAISDVPTYVRAHQQAREEAFPTQPPHHDRGEVNREWHESLRAGLKRYGFPRPELTRPVACDDGYWTPWHVALETLEAALTEAKQQGPGEAESPSLKQTPAWWVGYSIGHTARAPYHCAGPDEPPSHYMGDSVHWTPLYTAPQVEAKPQTGERDAARYDYLRQHRHVLLCTAFFGNCCVNKTMDDVDAEIDRRIAAAAKPSGEVGS